MKHMTYSLLWIMHSQLPTSSQLIISITAITATAIILTIISIGANLRSQQSRPLLRRHGPALRPTLSEIFLLGGKLMVLEALHGFKCPVARCTPRALVRCVALLREEHAQALVARVGGRRGRQCGFRLSAGHFVHRMGRACFGGTIVFMPVLRVRVRVQVLVVIIAALWNDTTSACLEQNVRGFREYRDFGK